MPMISRLKVPIRVALAWVTGVILCSAVAGCAADVRSPFEAMGHYELNHGRATDVLDLLRDGRFIHTYTPPGGRAAIDTGTWSFNFGDDGPQIFFGGFRARFEAELHNGYPEYSESQSLDSEPPGLTIMPIRRTITGTIKLGVDPDLDWAYIKKSRKE